MLNAAIVLISCKRCSHVAQVPLPPIDARLRCSACGDGPLDSAAQVVHHGGCATAGADNASAKPSSLACSTLVPDVNGTLAHNRLAQRVFWIIPTINRVDFRGGELTPRDGPPAPDPDTPRAAACGPHRSPERVRSQHSACAAAVLARQSTTTPTISECYSLFSS